MKGMGRSARKLASGQTSSRSASSAKLRMDPTFSRSGASGMSNARRDGGFANGPEKGSAQPPSEWLRSILEAGDRLWGDLATASKPFESRLYKLEGELRIAREYLKNARDPEERRSLRERIGTLSEHLLSWTLAIFRKEG